MNLKIELRCFQLKKYLELKELNDESWVTDSFFLVDITHQLNCLNLLLHGKNQIVTMLYDHVRVLKSNLGGVKIRSLVRIVITSQD